MTPIRLTSLQSLGPVLAKRWLSDGTIGDYDQARNFTVHPIPVTGIDHLERVIRELARRPTRCLIRGVLADPDGYSGAVERRIGVFKDEPSHLLMVDIDSFTPQADVVADPEAAIAEAIAKLPTPLQDAACVYQLSGSAGHPSKGNGLRCHLYYLLAEPLSCEDMEAWALKYLPGTDNTVHRTVQVNYTSAPVLDAGQVDPLEGRRVGLLPSLSDTVTIPADMPVPDTSHARRVKREDRGGMADPGNKPGVIGALCRAYQPAEVCDLFPEHFEPGRQEHRLTWLKGGGSKEGLCVCDNGHHLLNTHATAPVRHAVNLFDFVRVHVHGHLDAGLDADALELDITAAPSYQATERWARALPRVQQELTGPKAQAAAEAADQAKAELQLSTREQQLARIENMSAAIGKAEDIYVLEHRLGGQIRALDNLSEAERELLAQAMQKRTVALGTKLPIAVCRNWVEPVKLRLTYPDLDENGKLRGTIENIRAMCEKLGLRIRYNIITRQTEITGVTFRYTKDNKDEVILSHMLSECERAGIPVSRTNLKGHLLAIADIDAYNPVLDWIESKPWDGRSRMEALFDTMELQPTQNRDLARKMLRTWLIQGAALACSDKPVSSRGVLTLVGEQYMGKTRWLERLVGPLEGMFKNGHTLDVKQRDNVLQATSVWICELGELDGTFKRSEQAAFKSFMTATEDVHRRAYAATDSQYQRRTSFVGSVNQELFLADETGNTRLWCVACIRLNADHDIDMQQLWAEALFWWRAGEQHYLDKGTMQQLKQESEAHAVVNPLEEMIQGRFAWEEGRDDPESVDWVNLRATDLLRQVGWSKLDTRSAGVAGSAATKLGAKRFRGGREVQGAWLYRVPQRKGELADLLEAAVS